MSAFTDPEQAKILCQKEYPPTLTPLPVVEFLKALHLAVVRSDDLRSENGAKVALEELQHRVLMAAARFECDMGGVL